MGTSVSLGVVIGATLHGGFKGVLGAAQGTLTSLGSTVKDLDRQFKKFSAEQKLVSEGKFSFLPGELERMKALSTQLDVVKKKSKALREALNEHTKAKAFRANVLNDIQGNLKVGAAIAAPLTLSVKAFMDQDSAITDAKMAFMTAGGKVFEAFDAITQKAVELGNTRPGTATDFVNVARVLKEQGLGDNVILGKDGKGGALQGAVDLNVLLNTPQEFGAEFMAKLVEARGLKDDELVKATDTVQRARFAFGMKPEDMKDTMKYDAAMMNAMGLGGLENLKKNFALQGLLATNGIEAAQAGNVLKNLLIRTGEGVDGVMTAKKGNKAVARSQIEKAGVKFEFYDEKGNFKGMEGMMAEMQKLQIIKKKLGEKAAMNVANEIFGSENVAAAMVLATKGVNGFNDAVTKMDQQASIDERMREKQKSLAVVLDNLTGTVVTLGATIGQVFGPDIAEGAKKLNAFISDSLGPFLERHKGAIKTLVGFGLGFMSMRIGLGVLKYAYSGTLGELFRLVNTGKKFYDLFDDARKIQGLGRFAAALKALKLPDWMINGTLKGVDKVGGAFKTVFGGGTWSLRKGGWKKNFTRGGAFGMAGRALGAAGGAYGLYDLWQSDKNAGAKKQSKMQIGESYLRGAMSGAAIGMMFGPVGAVIGGVLGLIYTAVVRHWDRVVSVTKAKFSALKTVVGGYWNQIRQHPVRALAAIGKTILNWSPIGLFYKAFSAVMSYFGVELPSSFTGFGKMILQGLVNGFTSMFPTVTGKIVELGRTIKNIFTGRGEGGQVIQSPSRVWRGFGGHMMEGLDIGLSHRAPAVLSTVSRIGKSIKHRFKPAVTPSADVYQFRASLDAAAQASAAAPRERGQGVSIENHFNIYQQPGEDADALARRVVELIERKAGIRQRSALADLA